MGNNCATAKKDVEEISVEPATQRSETITSNDKNKETNRENRKEDRISRVEKPQQLAQKDAKIEVNDQKPSILKTKVRRSMITPFTASNQKDSLEKSAQDDDGITPPDNLKEILGKLMVEQNLNNDNRPKVAVINFRGLIGVSGITFDSYRPLITQAFKTPQLHAVFLNIDSNGGSPTQSEMITDYIKLLAKENEVKVYSFIQDAAVSGGYWLACAGDEIYVNKTSDVGNIGVISQSFGFQNILKSLNIERRITFAGKRKSANDPFSSQNDEDKKIQQKKVNQIHGVFIDHVKKCRGTRLNPKRYNELFNGSSWIGQDAVDVGLADRVQSMETFIRDNFEGPEQIKFIEYRHKQNPTQILSELLPMLPNNCISLSSIEQKGCSHNLFKKLTKNKEILKIEMLDVMLRYLDGENCSSEQKDIQLLRSIIKVLNDLIRLKK